MESRKCNTKGHKTNKHIGKIRKNQQFSPREESLNKSEFQLRRDYQYRIDKKKHFLIKRECSKILYTLSS